MSNNEQRLAEISKASEENKEKADEKLHEVGKTNDEICCDLEKWKRTQILEEVEVISNKSRKSSDWKAVIKNADMSVQMQKGGVDRALEDYSISKKRDYIWMQEVVDLCFVSEDDPIILLHWDWNGLNRFVGYVNPGLPNLPVSDTLNLRIGNQCTAQTVVRDISHYIHREVGGDRFQQKYPDAGLVIKNNKEGELGHLGYTLAGISMDKLVKHVLEHNIELGHDPIKFATLNIICEQVKVLDSKPYHISGINPLSVFE